MTKRHDLHFHMDFKGVERLLGRLSERAAAGELSPDAVLRLAKGFGGGLFDVSSFPRRGADGSTHVLLMVRPSAFLLSLHPELADEATL